MDVWMFTFVVAVVLQREVNPACPAVLPCCASTCGVVCRWIVILLGGDSSCAFVVDIGNAKETTDVDDTSWMVLCQRYKVVAELPYNRG